ncbi:V-type ATP synthase subunit E family protein [Proteiniclasticum sp.]|uniref:V-type ATP synthase subunit E n=1 Tax=Proteiniclasticum sp. TaxID=2053595 RepID=UPI0028982621|nr:V-type ATP synthase subunit E family protein [Proteiniclasticum sp.]
MQYNTIEELEEYFKNEIERVSQGEIKKIQTEIHNIENRNIRELEETARNNAEIIVNQEVSSMDSEHAISLSRMADDNQRKLMKKRQELINNLFLEIREKLVEYTKTDDYKEKMKERIRLLSTQYHSEGILKLALKDMKLADELSAGFSGQTVVRPDESIEIGGFILEYHQDRIIINETYDARLKEEREMFYANSELIIG